MKTLNTVTKLISTDIYYADKRKERQMDMVKFANKVLGDQSKAMKTTITVEDLGYNDNQEEWGVETSTRDREDYLGEYMARMGLQTTLYQMMEKHPHLVFKLNGNLIEEVWATVRHVDDESKDPEFHTDLEVVLLWKK